MRVVLIPCSGRKCAGGSSAATSYVRPLLSEDSWRSLVDARAGLAQMHGFEPGPDIGEARVAMPLLPAWQRYDGNLYRKGRLQESDLLSATTRIFVVSALFGIIDIRDSIRKYDLAMSDAMPGGGKVRRFWRDRGLIRVVGDLLRGLYATEVHDLLSGPYRAALPGLDHLLPSGCLYFRREYPGLGTGSNYHRGADLRAILDKR